MISHSARKYGECGNLLKPFFLFGDLGHPLDEKELFQSFQKKEKEKKK
eukprot:CAMPEP_0201498746 /NCGR_PEP_ID=MMETSP0151_2-20130828/72732_1 /ASSEMBLY_ACC=CAM_ASM_000257 /TAXON_ID=200890 /ORGANISM="Paramoeba atlantica, Strain 621/1 / CCAP 1560/9" /LENGTH=47 /DNA_ID= /DNA_START= /DNA_END= /DNA_ORIENTATION=